VGERHRVLGYIRGGGDMRVGSLVRAYHWEKHLYGVVVSIRHSTGICRVFLVHNPDYKFDQLIRDMEVICE